MKVIFRYCAFVMRQYKTSLVLIVLAMMSVQQIHGQNSCTKSVNYTLLTETTHALEDGTLISDLTILDKVKGKNEVQYTSQEQCIDALGFLTQTSTHQQGNFSFYPNFITKTVISSEGFRGYDADDNLVFQKEHLASEFSTPGFGEAMTTNQISHYGMGVDFAMLIDDAIVEYTSIAGQYWNTGNKYFFVNSAGEYIIDPDEKYTLLKKFDENNHLEMMSVQTFQMVDGENIPEYKVDYRYTNLSNGSTMQTTNSTVYLSYSVVENGQTVIEYVNDAFDVAEALARNTAENQTSFSSFSLPESSTVQLTIAPNPANDFVQIDFKNTWQGQAVNVQLLDNTSRKVASTIKNNDQQVVQLDTSHLPSGMYFIRCSASGKKHIEKLIINQN